MIEERINSKWKMILSRTGDAGVFGEQSDVRRKMDDQSALDHFAKVWRQTLEPEVRKAPVISVEEVKELLEGKQREYAVDDYQFRQFSLYSVVFVVRLNQNATENGTCDQLWQLGAHRDNTRLCMYFNSITEKERFERIAQQLHREPKNLALQLALDFVQKFSVDDQDYA